MKYLWYRKPAVEWSEALPLGNGRIGAMVFGGVREEHLQINEESIWSGRPIDRNNPDCIDNLEKMRNLIFQGEIEKAERLAVYAMSGTPQSERCYQTLGDIYIRFDNKEEEYEDYKRTLDMDNALSTVSYRIKDNRYERKTFITYPNQAMVMKFKVDGDASLNFTCLMDRHKHLDCAWKEDTQTIAYDGNTGEGGIKFACMLRAVTNTGTVNTIGEHLIVEGAKEVTLYFTVSTSFWENDPAKACLKRINEISKKDYEELFKAHVNDYIALFDRVELKFISKDNAECESLPTDERLELIQKGKNDIDLIALYFQYGRYLLISSSRPGGLPANLQGIWNKEFMPPWDSKYTININTEMNYWPAEVGNLSECSEPFFRLLERMKENGQVTASKMYGCRGFVAHHNTDIHADTAPQDHYVPATYWVMGAAWMSLHIWEHYLFTKDKEFLNNNFDTLYQAVLFFKDYLIEDSKKYLVTCPSVSPENTYIMKNGRNGRFSAGVSMDNQILYNLFNDYLSAASIICPASEFIDEVKIMLDRLPKPQIGKYGQLMEWMEDYEEAEPGHRHISHLFAVYPGSQITPEDTPELATAAEITLNRRLEHGGGHTGWSRAWIIDLWARFGKSEKVFENIMELLKQSTFINLMDNHPNWYGNGKIFQIDGNFGAAAGIAEMLIQSHNNKIRLLPALPKACNTGYVKGLRLRENADIEMYWKDGELDYAIINPMSDFEAFVFYKENKEMYSFKKGIKVFVHKNQTSRLIIDTVIDKSDAE